MISRKPKEEKSTTPLLQSTGFAACVIACVIIYQVFTDRPPKFENLLPSDAQVTRAAYLKWHLKGLDHVFAPLSVIDNLFTNKPRVNYSYPAIDLDGHRVWIATSFQSEASPRELHDLAAGEKVKVWTWIADGEKYVWHVTHRNRTVLDYETIVRRDAEKRQLFLYAALAGLLVGIVLLFLRI